MTKRRSISPDVIQICRETKFDKNGNCLRECQGKIILDPKQLYSCIKKGNIFVKPN